MIAMIAIDFPTRGVPPPLALHYDLNFDFGISFLSTLRSLLFFIAACLVFQILKMVYNCKLHGLRRIPGPWISCSTSLWICWQRWNGRTSYRADELLSKYGPIVRISPSIVLINDPEAVERAFVRKDLDSAPTSIRSLRIGRHDWVISYPQHPIARQRRYPVLMATTTKCMKFWHEAFAANVKKMVDNIAVSRGSKSEDIVHHLRVCTFRNSQIIMGGSHTDVKAGDLPHVVREYNYLVVWRLCLPAWAYSWLKFGPSAFARFRVNSSDRLFDVGDEICRQAEMSLKQDKRDAVPNVFQLLTDRNAKFHVQDWTRPELGAEIAGQILAATETTSSALTYIFYELAKNQALMDELYEELSATDSDEELDSLKLLDACMREGLRFRPPVAFTGSRLIPKGGLDILGYHLPAGTTITTQSLSTSRQRPDLFPDCHVFNPKRWIEGEQVAERRRLWVPFGVGARRCPGSNMALYQMRMVLFHTIRSFKITVAPETTPYNMEPFEASGFRSRTDRCDLTFTPRV